VTREQALPIVAPDVGLVYGSPRHTIPERGWWQVENVVFRRGWAELVGGWSLFQTLDSKVMGITEYRTANLSTRAWFAVTRGKAWKRSDTDSQFVDVTGATALTGNEDSYAHFAQFRNMLIFTNGKDPVKKWEGTGNIADLGGNPPKAKLVALLQNHVVLGWIDPGGPSEDPQRIQWSDIGNPEVWSGGDAGALSLRDEPTPIVAMAQMRDSLIVYKPNAIYLVDYTGFPFTMSTRRIVAGVGPISGRAVIFWQDVHYFLGGDGVVYRLTPAGVEPVGQAVERAIIGELNYDRRHHVFGWAEPDRGYAYWAIPPSGEQDPAIIYALYVPDLRWGRELRSLTAAAQVGSIAPAKVWDDLTGAWDASTMVWNDALLASGSPVTLAGDASGRIYTRASESTGTAVLETKMFDFGDPTRKKRLKRVHVQYEAPEGTILQLYVLAANNPLLTPTSYGPYSIALDGSGDQWVDVDVTGQWLGLRFVASASKFRLAGYVPVFHVREVT